MLPISAINHEMDGLVAKAKCPGYGRLRGTTLVKSPNLQDKIRGKAFGVSMLPYRVVDVCPVRGPLQVTGSVVKLIEVLVMDVAKAIWVRIMNKGPSHQCADISHSLLPVFAEDQVSVARVVDRTCQEAASPPSEGFPASIPDKSVQAANQTRRGNLVKALVSNYWLPSFFSIHSLISSMFPMVEMKGGEVKCL